VLRQERQHSIARGLDEEDLLDIALPAHANGISGVEGGSKKKGKQQGTVHDIEKI